MKLLKCCAENFGTLSKFKMDFGDGLNTVMQENGWGKSTLAAFVKAMFYGLPVTTSPNLDKNERQRYLPWQGGKFGGSLEFEYKNKQYRIERFFGGKHSEDTFKLIDLATGKQSSDFSSKIGDEIFGIDSEAYERSTYLPQKNIEFAANTSISAKLSKLVENTDDINNFDSAIDSIDSRIKYYKKIGNKGRLADIDREIFDVKEKIASCHRAVIDAENLAEEKNKKQAELIITKNQLQDVNKQLGVASKSASAAHYVMLKNNLTRLEDEHRALASQYGNGIPESYTIDKQIYSANSLLRTDSLIDSANNSRDRIYIDCISEDLKSAENCIEHAKQLGRASESVAFAPNLQKRKICFIAMILAAVLIVTGIVLAVVSVLIPGIVVLSIGLIAFIACAAVYFKPKKVANTQELRSLEKQYKEEIEAFLFRFTLPPFTDYLEKLYEVKAGIDASLKLQQQIKTLSGERKNLTDALDAFLSEYGVTSSRDYIQDLYKLKSETQRFSALKTEIPAKTEELTAFVKQSGIDESSVTINKLPEQLGSLEGKQQSLSEHMETLSGEIARIEQRIEQKLKLGEDCDDFESKLESLTAEKAEGERKLFALENAKKFITEAKESLSVKYLTDMKGGFTKYFNLLDGNDIEGFDMDTDLNIKIIAAGESKDIDYFSSGSRDLIGLCTRFALIDAMFKAEKPFIILDDPFINLDDRRTECAIELIEKIAKELQIVYLVCNTSRIAK